MVVRAVLPFVPSLKVPSVVFSTHFAAMGSSNIVTETLLFVAGVVYPAHASLLAVQSSSREDSVQWLCYWVLRALLVSLEEVFEFALEWCA